MEVALRLLLLCPPAVAATAADTGDIDIDSGPQPRTGGYRLSSCFTLLHSPPPCWPHTSLMSLTLRFISNKAAFFSTPDAAAAAATTAGEDIRGGPLPASSSGTRPAGTREAVLVAVVTVVVVVGLLSLCPSYSQSASTSGSGAGRFAVLQAVAGTWEMGGRRWWGDVW